MELCLSCINPPKCRGPCGHKLLQLCTEIVKEFSWLTESANGWQQLFSLGNVFYQCYTVMLTGASFASFESWDPLNQTFLNMNVLLGPIKIS